MTTPTCNHCHTSMIIKGKTLNNKKQLFICENPKCSAWHNAKEVKV